MRKGLIYVASTFRWLHLSDIHYMLEPDSVHIRNRIKKKLNQYVINNPEPFMNCVVITGDFLQQGKYLYTDEPERYDCLTFIHEICNICLYPSLREKWEEYVVFCPGNHDINRLASQKRLKQKDVVCRETVLKRAIKNSPDRMIDQKVNTENSDYNLLTNETFWLYDELFCEPYKKGAFKGNYEYRIFCSSPIRDPSARTSDTLKKDLNRRIIFIALNTALYAGQQRDKEEIRHDLADAEKVIERNKMNNHPDYSQSRKDYAHYLSVHQELICGEARDEGKLCFISRTSENEIKESLKTLCDGSAIPYFILIGHHPLSWMTLDAQKHFANFADSLDQTPVVYLCGHEHKPKVHRPEVNRVQAETFKPVEIEVGGDFADDTEWNTPSFAIDTLCFEDDNSAYLKGEVFCWCKYLEKNCIEFATENSFSYGWQKVDFGQRKEILLKTKNIASNDNVVFNPSIQTKKIKNLSSKGDPSVADDPNLGSEPEDSFEKPYFPKFL